MGGAVAGIGDTLRSTRERRGLSIAEVAQETRISARFLEALEAEQFEELPAPVYVRGFIRSYANYLRIEPQPLLDQLVGGAGAVAAPAGYVGGNGRGEAPATRRRSDPFQRHGVVPMPQPAAPRQQPGQAPTPPEPEPDAWSPEPPAPLSDAPVDHGYIPGSDLMEAPETYEYPPEPEPIYRPRTQGVLVERPPSGGEPGIPRRVALLAIAVAGVLGFLALAVFLTRDDDGNGSTNAAANNPTQQITPSTVIPVTTRTVTPNASASPSASASASVSASPSPSGTPSATTTPGTPTPRPTEGTPTATPTTAPTNTPAPTATATPTSPPPTVAPTVGAPPHPSTYSACDLNRETEKCGSSYVRIICYPPFAEADPTGKNDNYFVDVTGAYPLQDGWRETTVFAPVSIGPVIAAGRNGCI